MFVSVASVRNIVKPFPTMISFDGVKLFEHWKVGWFPMTDKLPRERLGLVMTTLKAVAGAEASHGV